MLNVLRCVFPYDTKYHQWPQVLAVIIVSMGAFINGAIVNWTSPSIPILISNASYIGQITLEEASYFTVIPTATAALASPVFAYLVDSIGRKPSVMLVPSAYLISWILIICASNYYIIYLSRFFLGIADCAVFTAVPMYVGEICEPKIRGSWGNLVALSMFIGFFFINTIGSYCDIVTTACIFAVITAIQLPLVYFIPESPYYLLMKNNNSSAKASLAKFRWTDNVEEEYALLKKCVKLEMENKCAFLDLFKDSTNFKTLLISLGIRATQPFSGSPAFTMYTQYMFLQAGSSFSASTCAIIFSGAFAISMGGFSFVVERLGRKPLMIFSSFSCALVLLIVSIYFYINENTSVYVSNITWLPLAGMLTYVPLCSAGFTLIPNLMLAELFATNVKAKSLCILNVWYALLLLVVTKLFPTLTSLYGIYTPFALFSICCFISGVFSMYFLPETKGKTLKEIQEVLKGSNH